MSEDNRVFVGGLPWSISEEDLKQVFSKYGEVVDARVVIDRETGRSRGFGFISYAESSSVDECIAALDGQDLQGRTIRVNKAMTREQRDDEFASGRGGGGRGRYGETMTVEMAVVTIENAVMAVFADAKISIDLPLSQRLL
ncbi:Glycine-rich RNA-binding protein RZ1A [Galdieria sulphuraria]|nr:Glycine-rich RNA-binding protein RZ1A [Galdieria sulphuraria]